MKKELFEKKFELLKQEIDIVQQGIRTYDNISFIIKGWAITIFSSLLYLSFNKENSSFIIYSALAVILFWFLDSIYKSIQKVYITRHIAIEKYLRTKDFDLAVEKQDFGDFVITDINSGFKHQKNLKIIEVLYSGSKFHTYILYFFMILINLAMFTIYF